MTDRCETAKPEFQKVLRSLAAQLRQSLPIGAFGDRERAALALANELVRGVLEQDLQDIADSFGDFVEYRGQTYRRHLQGNARYPSLCGPIEVARYTSPFKVTSFVILREAARWTRASCPRTAFAWARASWGHEGDVGISSA
jgi:hypothetical protein